MKHKYRVVKVIKSDGQVEKQHDEVNERHEGQIILVEKTHTHRASRWLLGILIAIVLIVLILWMVATSSTLSQMNNTVHQQSEYLSNQSTQLANIRAKLNTLSQQLNELNTYIKMTFDKIRQIIQGHP